jgi:hypothetical protein
VSSCCDISKKGAGSKDFRIIRIFRPCNEVTDFHASVALAPRKERCHPLHCNLWPTHNICVKSQDLRSGESLVCSVLVF